MSTAKLLTTNTIAQTVAKALSVLTTLAIGRMIADDNRGLGLTGFSDYAIIVSYVAYFYIICDFGFNAVAIKDITEDEQKTSSHINNLLGLRIVLSACLIMAGLAILVFLPYSAVIKIGIIISLITVISQAIITNSNILFQAKLQYWQSTIAIGIGSLVSLSIASLNFFSAGSLFLYIMAALAGSAVMAAISLMLVNNQVSVRPRFDWRVWKYFIIAALPLGLAIALNLIYIRSGFFILSLHNGVEFGLLSAAYRIFDVALVIPVFIVNALYPIMIQRLQIGVDSFKKLFIRSLWLMLGSSLVIAGAIWIFAPLAIHVSTGNQDFEQSITILRWLGALTPIFFVTNLLLWAIIAMGKRKAVVFFYGIGALISLSLNMWLVPQYGYWGIIISTAIAESIIGLLLAGQVVSLWRNPRKNIGLLNDQPQASQLTEDEVVL